MQKKNKIHVGVICGGPSLERGISLNSARSVLDHLASDSVEIHPIYVDFLRNYYLLSIAQLYSNTPEDFDFKLKRTATKLSKTQLIKKLKALDIVFPVMHGVYGEDGELQAFLEKHDIPFVGCDKKTCQEMFYKNVAGKTLVRHGFHTIPSAVLKINSDQNEKIIYDFFAAYNLKRAIVKPIAGGSSIGVFSVDSPVAALEKLAKLFSLGVYTEALIEPFCYGREFTVIVLQNHAGDPVALVPTEIQVSYENDQIFDYRRKYLPTSNTKWHCPPRFENKIISEIQKQAEKIFKLFSMRDFVRLDGWLLDDGRVVFTDLNPISGMEQNSFIFQQGSRVGLTHHDVLTYVLTSACKRYNVAFEKHQITKKRKKLVHVLFGGNTAERHVSLMSGTNVWLKLRQSKIFAPEPYFLDKKGQVWYLPYTYTLNHTTDEIYENCLTSSAAASRLAQFVKKVRERLGINSLYEVEKNLPYKTSFKSFIANTKKANAFLFLALHGGEGESGVIQQKLTDAGVLYNGSRSQGSELCIDKYLTGLAIAAIGDENILTAPKKSVPEGVFEAFATEDWQKFWQKLVADFNAHAFIIKPQNDGCSAGIVRIVSLEDLIKYFTFVKNKAAYIPAGTFAEQNNIIEMPVMANADFLLEKYIETDVIRIENQKVIYKKTTGWLEYTVGIMETHGEYHVFNPSITIADGLVLSLEEKFQSGTGVNITPPPETIVPKKMRKLMQAQIKKVAKALGIANYARIDFFFNAKTGKMIVIEANTLPGLTPSTVIFHQALAEKPSMSPVDFLERIILSASIGRKGN